MSANTITTMRTASAGAVAAKYLARKDAESVAVIGAGVQARAQLSALREIYPVKRVYNWDRNTEASQAYAKAFPDVAVTVAATIQEAVEDADIIITTTPSKTPIVRSEWVRIGTHINAIGADAVGKQELETALVVGSRFIADNREQSSNYGEWQHVKEVSHEIFAELGEIIVGKKPGRTGKEDLTIFDATGVSFQDMEIAGRALQQILHL
jgi:ornithine cyclodeaminase/alanine dehydrogenase-like protein (mu-crystallin family)